MKLLTNTRENTDTNSDKKTTRDYLVEKICNLLKKGQSLYLEGESGFGKSDICEKVAKNLKSEGLPVATLAPGTAKEILIGVAEDLGIDPNDENDKPMTTTALRKELTEHLRVRSCFLICDNLPQIPVGLRLWLDKLYVLGQPILGTGKNKPEKDVIFKLIKLNLEPLTDEEITVLINKTTTSLGININPQELVQKANGNPGLAIKLVKEIVVSNEGIDIKKAEPEHKKWFALDRWIVLLIAMLALFRYAGKDPLLVIGGSAMILSRFGSQVVRYTPKKG